MGFGAVELNGLGGRGLCPGQGAPWAVGLWAEVLAGHVPAQACRQVLIVQNPKTFCFDTSRISSILF